MSHKEVEEMCKIMESRGSLYDMLDAADRNRTQLYMLFMENAPKIRITRTEIINSTPQELDSEH